MAAVRAPGTVPPMSAAAEHMMLFVGKAYEESRFPPIEAWTIDGLLHEQKLKFELQAVGLLDVRPDGSCRLTSAGKDWIMWRRLPDPAPSPSADEPMSRAAEWMMNRLALSYQQARYPPHATWTFPAQNGDPVMNELRARALIEAYGATGPQSTTWRFTDAGQRWAMAHVQR